jgi:hypothetical protein
MFLSVGLLGCGIYIFEAARSTHKEVLAHQDELLQNAMSEADLSGARLEQFNRLFEARETHFIHGSPEYWAQPPGHLDFYEWNRLGAIPQLICTHDPDAVAARWSCIGMSACAIYASIVFGLFWSARKRSPINSGVKPQRRLLRNAGAYFGVGAIIAGIGVPNLRRTIAQDHLDEIIENLKRIDQAAVWAWMESSQSEGAPTSRSELDGEFGAAYKYIDWPAGPVPGVYEVSVIGAKATFNGGLNGRLNAAQWESTCRQYPISCGL